MEVPDLQRHKSDLSARFKSYLQNKRLSCYDISKILYDNYNKTPNNVYNGKHLPNFEFIWRLKHNFKDLDLNWFVYGELIKPIEVSEPVGEYKTSSDIMLSENKRLLKEKHDLLNENTQLKNKLIKAYEILFLNGISPVESSDKNSDKKGLNG